MRSILYSTLPHPLLRPVLCYLPERVLDQMVVGEGVELAAAAAQAQAAASALEVLRTAVGYSREYRRIDKSKAVVGHGCCCCSTVDRQASHGSDEEASGLSPQSAQKTLGSIHISIIQNITSYWLAEEANISSLVASYLWNRRLDSLATRTPHSSEPLCDGVERTLWLVGRVAWLRLSTLTVSSGGVVART
jgi:hypothetical protein